MGRRKVQIKRIEDDRARKVTFAKRKHGLVKKAMELSLLCDCDIALLIFTREKPDQRFYKYTSSSIDSVLAKLSKNPPVVEDRHNGQYEQLYVKKSKEGSMEGSLDMLQMAGQAAPAGLGSQSSQAGGGPKRNLSVEIPGAHGGQPMDLGALNDLNTPNSMALFQQLGSNLMNNSGLQLSPNAISLGSLGGGPPSNGSGGMNGTMNFPSPNTLAAFAGPIPTGTTPRGSAASSFPAAGPPSLSTIREATV